VPGHSNDVSRQWRESQDKISLRMLTVFARFTPNRGTACQPESALHAQRSLSQTSCACLAPVCSQARSPGPPARTHQTASIVVSTENSGQTKEGSKTDKSDLYDAQSRRKQSSKSGKNTRSSVSGVSQPLAWDDPRIEAPKPATLGKGRVRLSL